MDMTSIAHHPLAALLTDPVIAPYVPWIAAVPDVLSPAECAATIARIEALGPTPAGILGPGGERMNTQYRDNDRAMFEDPALAAMLWTRLASVVPPARRAVGLNERFRGYRYDVGQKFAAHLDGTVALPGRHSELTVLVYLNEDCEGGQTRFVQWNVAVRPRRGLALLFQHDVFHEGCEVRGGRKYVLRSDVMVRSTR